MSYKKAFEHERKISESVVAMGFDPSYMGSLLGKYTNIKCAAEAPKDRPQLWQVNLRIMVHTQLNNALIEGYNRGYEQALADTQQPRPTGKPVLRLVE